MSSSPWITAFAFMALLFCLLLGVRSMEENPRLVEKSMPMKISGRRSLGLHKGLLPHYEATDDFSWNGSEGGAVGAREMMSLLRDDDEVKNGSGTREEGVDASQGKRSRVWEDAVGGRGGFMGSTAKVGLGVRDRLRLRSKRKGKGGSNRGYAGGFVAFNADYHFPRQHPPRNN